MSRNNKSRRNRRSFTNLRQEGRVENPLPKSIIMPGEDFYTVYRVTSDNPQKNYHPLTKWLDFNQADAEAARLAAANPNSEFAVLFTKSHHFGPSGGFAAVPVPKPTGPQLLPDPQVEPVQVAV